MCIFHLTWERLLSQISGEKVTRRDDGESARAGRKTPSYPRDTFGMVNPEGTSLLVTVVYTEQYRLGQTHSLAIQEWLVPTMKTHVQH